MSVRSSTSNRALRLRADVPVPKLDRLSTLARPAVLALGAIFVVFGGANLELGELDAKVGLASGELGGPFGRVFGYWDPSVWPLPVSLGRIWAYFEEVGPSQGVVRWPSAIAGLLAGFILSRRARLTFGPRAGLFVALSFFGTLALMDRARDTGLDLLAGLGTIAALDRLLTKGSGWVVGAWASLAFLAAGWPPLAVLALATIVLGRAGSTWSWSMGLPVLATVGGWAAWAMTSATAEAVVTAIALPITQPSAWSLPLIALGLGMPWAPFALMARNRSIRDTWKNGDRSLVIDWLKVAGASLLVGTIVPGLASAALLPALAGLAIVSGCSCDRLWAASGDLPQAVCRRAIRLSLTIAGLWFIVALTWGGYVGFAIAYYRSTVIIVAILSLAALLLAVHSARFGEVRWAIGGIIVVSFALKLAHWGYFVPEWNYRYGAGPWGRAIGQWVPEKHPIYVFHPSWKADLAFAIKRPVRRLRLPEQMEFMPGEGSKFVLLQDVEYSEYLSWNKGWPKLLKVTESEDEEGFHKRILTRTDAPLIVERPYRKHDPKVE